MADPVRMLEQDHRKVEQLFEQYKATQDPATVQEICTELTVHTTIEEEVVYPVVARDLAGGKDLDKEARKEHQEVEDAILEIERLGYDDPGVAPFMQTIIEGVTHHVEEEESEMFPKLREEVGRNTFSELGDKLATAKERAMQQVGSGEVIDLTTMTKDQLYEKAQQADIEGRSDMTKEQLVKALQRQ
jgi:hemerythrin superfamily protein